jgi:hypothetical protein
MTLARHLLPWAKYVKRSFLAAPLPGEKDTRPYCVYDEAEAELFYAQSQAVQNAWNKYCQHEIKTWNAREYLDRQAHMFYQWKPEKGFTRWLADRSR